MRSGRLRKNTALALAAAVFTCGAFGTVSAQTDNSSEKETIESTLLERGQPGDYNGDGVINVFDLMRYKNSFIEEKGFYSTGESAIDVNKVQPCPAVL